MYCCTLINFRAQEKSVKGEKIASERPASSDYLAVMSVKKAELS
jgi:hypothetical protein